MTQSEKYLMEALDAYPFNLEQVIESLNYALSYDDENPLALCLMGQVYSEQLSQYETAKDYFVRALSVDIHNLKVYPLYADVLLYNDDFEEAEKTIDFALTIKGIDKAVMYGKKALLHEYQMQYKKALKCWKKAKQHCYNSSFMNMAEAEEKRVESKLNLKKKKVKSVEGKKH